MGLYQIKNFCSSENTVKRMKGQDKHGRKRFSSQYLIQNISRLSKLNNEIVQQRTKHGCRLVSKEVQIVNKHMRRSSLPLVTRKCKATPRWDTASHPLELLKLKRLPTPRFAEYMCTGCGNVGATNTWERRLAVSCKVEHKRPIWPSCSLCRSSPKRKESRYPHKDLDTSVHVSSPGARNNTKVHH